MNCEDNGLWWTVILSIFGMLGTRIVTSYWETHRPPNNKIVVFSESGIDEESDSDYSDSDEEETDEEEDGYTETPQFDVSEWVENTLTQAHASMSN